MAFIVEQLIGDRGLQIGVEDVIRPFTFGTNWSKIKVGILYAVNGYASLPAGVNLNLGVCTGNSAALATCTDAVWIQPLVPASGGVYGGSAPNNYYSNGGINNILFSQKVGSTTSTFGAYSAANGALSANPSANRSIFTYSITKGTVGAASITNQVTYMTTGQVTSEFSRSAFLLAMENESTSPSGATTTTATAANLPLRFTKDWDSMYVGWNRSTPTAVIYCMTVVRFA